MTPSNSDLAIDAVGLRRTFGDVVAVDDVNIAVKTGEIYGFLGPNGAGKSTCVKMLCTMLRLTDGKATVAGYDVEQSSLEVRLNIGVAQQEAAIDPKQTGREFLRLQARLFGLSKAQAEARISELGHLIDVEALDRRIDGYSGGMKRRLDLAASLVHNPPLVFLDEPTTGLDPVARLEVWDEIRTINEQLGVTVFLTTQYLEEADALCDRVGIISAGKIVAEGTPEELKRSIGADVVIAEVDGSNRDEAAGIVDQLEGVDNVSGAGGELVISATDGPAIVGPVAIALDRANIAVRSLTLRTPTLDDVFLELTGAHLEVDQ